MNRIKKELKILFRGVRLLFEIETAYIVLLIVSNILSAIIPYINIYFIARLVNELAGSQNTKIIFIYVALTVSLTALLMLTLNGLNHLKDYHQEQFFKNEKLLFSTKSMEMDFGQLEKQETTLLLERVNIESQTGYNTYYLYTFLGHWITSLTNIAASFSLTWSMFFNKSVQLSIRLGIVALMIVVIIVGLLASKKVETETQEMFDKFIPFNMLDNFYSNFLRNYNTGKDIRIYNLEQLIADKQKQMDMKTYQIHVTTKRYLQKFLLANSTTADILKVVIYILITLSCLSGCIAIGNITQYVTCTTLFVVAVGNLVNQTQVLFHNNKYLENYFHFLDLPSELHSGTEHVKTLKNGHVVEFHHVSFRYPQSDAFVLKDLCLKIRPGTKIAVVGVNGSGKTTMIKLLCRLYEPTEGYITLDGVDIRTIDYPEYVRLWGIVFQDFKLFSMPIGQNIAANVQYSKSKIEEILKKLDFDSFVYGLPQGLETTLYKDFDENGHEISGGEAQKIAFARALYKDTLFLILDEPTAALDPLAEAQIYTQFNSIVGERTTIYISHRLVSCKFCDEIIVFDDGQLIQYGTHEELVRNTGGKYYELWQAQAQHYQ